MMKTGMLKAMIYDGVLADVKETVVETENKQSFTQLVLTFGLNESYFNENVDHFPVTGPSVDSNAGIVMRLRNE